MELWIHVHRIYWIYFPQLIFGDLDCACLNNRTACCLGLAVQVHPKRGRRARNSLALFTGIQHHWLTRSKGGRCSIGCIPVHLCCCTTDCGWSRTRSYAQLGSYDRYSHRFRSRCCLLLRWRYPCLNMDRCCPIMRHDCRLYDTLPRSDRRIWRVFRSSQSTGRDRPCNGKSLPNWT